MGGAFTAVADDWTAIFWNPAGLTQLERNEFGNYIEWLQGSFQDRNGVKNFTASNFSLAQKDIFLKINATEPDVLPSRKSKAEGLNPSFGGTLKLSDGYSFGFGSFVPLGTAAEFDGIAFDETTGAKLDYTFSNSFFLLINNFSLAKKISDHFAIGVGLDISLGELELKVVKNSTGGTGVEDYSAFIGQKANGWALGGVLGLMFFPTKNLRLGFNYKTKTTMELDGDAVISNSALAAIEESSLNSTLLLPATYSLGIAWQATPSWLVSADVRMTDWRPQKDKIIYKTPGPLLAGVNARSGWRRAFRYRLGSDFILNSNWSFQMGYTYDQSAVPKNSLSLTGLVDVNQHIVTAGPTWKKDSWSVDLAYLYAYGSEKLGPGDRYQQVVSSFYLGGTYYF